MSGAIYSSKKGSVISSGGSVPISDIDGKIHQSYLKGFGNKRIEMGSTAAPPNASKQTSVTVLFTESYPTPPKVYLSLRTLYWNDKSTAGTMVLTAISTDSFTVTCIVNSDSADVAWQISTPITIDWFSVGDFDTE